jgi:uncharacterized protein (TIGR00369 family)
MTAGSRLIEWEDPSAIAAMGRDLSGLEFLTAIKEGRIPQPPISKLLGFYFTHLEHGAVHLVLPIGPHLYNPIGSVHGGIAATVLDTVMGCSIHSMLPKGRAYSTLEIKISYLRPMTQALGEVTVEGRVLNLGRKAAFAEGKILDSAGKLYATGTTTCAVWDA